MALFSSVHLTKLTDDMRAFAKMGHMYKQTAMIMMISPIVQCALNLHINSAEPCVMAGEALVEADFIPKMKSNTNDNNSVPAVFWTLYLQVIFTTTVQEHWLSTKSRNANSTVSQCLLMPPFTYTRDLSPQLWLLARIVGVYAILGIV
jgi:hypothetical protein